MTCNQKYGVSNQNSNARFDASLEVYVEAIQKLGYRVLDESDQSYVALEPSGDGDSHEHIESWLSYGGRVSVISGDGDETPIAAAGADLGDVAEVRVYGDASVVNSEGDRLLVVRRTDDGQLVALMP